MQFPQVSSVGSWPTVFAHLLRFESGISCNNMDAFESHLAFETCSVGSIFNPIYVVRPPISIPGSSLPLVPRPCGVIAVASPEHEAEEDNPDKHEVLRVFRAKRTVTG